MRVKLARQIASMLAIVLCVGVLAVISGCSSSDSNVVSSQASSETRIFVDSLGREVEVPVEITAIAPSGHTAQQVLLTMAPEKMVGLSEELSSDQLKYFDASMANLPVFGTAFGSKGSMNKEAVAAAAPQVIVDTGEATNGLTEDLDNLQAQLGIPVVFINTPLDDYLTAYTMLGDLLGMEERGKLLGEYSENAYNEVAEVMAGIPETERVDMLYLMGDAGLNVLSKGSYQGAVIDLCANNLAVVDNPSSRSMGDEVSLEQIAVWNPELIVFGKGSIYDSVSENQAWKGIEAIDGGAYYEVPSSPYIWLNSPATINQIMGVQWLPRLLYPAEFETSLQDVTTEYYKLFYGYDLSQSEYDALVANAVPQV